jgi:glycosyltransferase involved in cell wall biosynthesis
MKRIRLLHLVASSRGGGATHVRDLALGLDLTRFAVQVAMPEDGGNVRREDFEAAGIPFHRVDFAAGFSLQTLWPIRRLAIQVNILHAHGARAAFWGRLATTALGAKRPEFVYSIHGFMIPHYPLPRRLLLWLQEKIQSLQVDKYIAVSFAEREALRRAGLAKDDKIAVVWYGIEIERFEKTTVDRDTLRSSFEIGTDEVLLAMICRFFWPRDFHTLLHAFHQAIGQVPNLRLLLVGDGPWRSQIETLLDELNLRGRVIMPGLRQDISNLLHAADVFVLTSGGGDGLPISILEAMAAARPVIATASDGIPEEVIHGKTGFIPGLRDVSALAEAIVKLAQNPDLRQRMGKAGRQRVRREFARERMIEAMTNIYDDLLNATDSRTP